ncbi:hypothetical protein [Streptomyces sp. NBC_00353]|uniref:hypothetical protein n=1 Tax=Streptomyces sp. NBC_00353 TaxID=2975722 RepID=UPI003FA76DB1
MLVDVDGVTRKPWITWFTDCATNAITGVTVTPVYPSRESVLAALRSAVLREDPYGPFGGLPEEVRVDRGKDFLSRTVTAAFEVLDVTVEDLPAYTPHLKGTVEGLNRAVETMLLASLPGYVRQPRPGKRSSRPKDEVLLGFEDFTARFPGRIPAVATAGSPCWSSADGCGVWKSLSGCGHELWWFFRGSPRPAGGAAGEGRPPAGRGCRGSREGGDTAPFRELQGAGAIQGRPGRC